MLVNRYCQVIIESPSSDHDEEGIRRFSSNYYEIAERYLCVPANQNKVLSAGGSKNIPWKMILGTLAAVGLLAALYFV